MNLECVQTKQVGETKLLGVTADECLTRSDHLDNILVKLGQCVAVTQRCSPDITPSVR